MSGAKPVHTPMSTSYKFHAESPLMDATLYRSIVGSLHYLALTCLDIAFSVNCLAQHMQHPTNDHFQALK